MTSDNSPADGRRSDRSRDLAPYITPAWITIVVAVATVLIGGWLSALGDRISGLERWEANIGALIVALDAKVDRHSEAINTRIDRLSDRIDVIVDRTAELRAEVAELRTDMTQLRMDMNRIDQRLDQIIERLKTRPSPAALERPRAAKSLGL